VNALLSEARPGAGPCEVFELFRPPELEQAKRADDSRYAAGLPHLLDLPAPA
jgi:hypothetical protein